MPGLTGHHEVRMMHIVHPALRRSLVATGLAVFMALATVAPASAEAAPVVQGATGPSASSAAMPVTASASLASLSLLASGRASWSTGRTAADRALSQVGSRYRYGGTGTSSFDCSGLTGYAWGRTGVDLPRSSRAQSNRVRSISRSDLRPGDLVFFGKPVSHVEMYVGDGRLVGSSRSKGRVVTTSMYRRSNISGYGRP
jgi:peptidoglycan DL-endopeptidase CwlO